MAFVSELRAGFRSAAFCLLALQSASVLAHGEQIKVGAAAKGPIKLTPAQETALGLTLASASGRPVAEVLYLNGEVKPVAGRQGQASSRIAGSASCSAMKWNCTFCRVEMWPKPRE